MNSPRYLEWPVSTVLRFCPSKLVISVSGEKHIRLDSVKQSTDDSSLNDVRCSLVVHSGMVI